MGGVAVRTARPERPGRASTPSRRTLPDQRFDAFVFDWDGTAVPDRSADATAVRERIEALCAAAANVYVVSGTHVGNVDGQLAARPRGPGRLFLCLNRGSEVYAVDADGARLVYRRVADADEEAALDAAAAETIRRLEWFGLRAEIVSSRLNRRKIDLIPEPAWRDPPKAIIDRLLAAVTNRLHGHGIDDLAMVVRVAREAALAAGLDDPRITSDVKHVEIGLTDKADSMRWALRDLERRGIGPGLVAIAGDEFGSLGGVVGSDAIMLVPGTERATAFSVGVEPAGVPRPIVPLGGGPERFLAFLDDQLRRRTDRRVPAVDADPEWCLVVDGDVRLARVREALLTLAEPPFGVRGAVEEDGVGSDELLVAAGSFDSDGTSTMLTEGPLWTRLGIASDPKARERRILDMRGAVLLRERAGDRGAVRTLRFLSATEPGIMAMRAEGPPDQVAAGPAFVFPPGGDHDEELSGDIAHARTLSRLGGGIAAAAITREGGAQDLRTIERVASYETVHDEMRSTAARGARAARADLDRLLAAHRAAWADRWRDAAITIEGDPESQLAARFATFHLLGAAGSGTESAVGARGVSGRAYGGHVFWDSEVFVLPAMIAIKPAAARAMLGYRIRRLDAARRAGQLERHDGARFPWESATHGDDVTPTMARTPEGRIVPIRTGQHEVHIVADIAWAAFRYSEWTGDEAFLNTTGRSLVTETARYWASRIRVDRSGDAHLYGVTGPDEYHEIVDDNAFTNVMARWNLRRAAELVERDGRGGARDEAERWRDLADRLVDGYDPRTGIYEQFPGFAKLEPLVIAELSRTPVAADVLLGRERVQGAQVIKQPDVLMLHHMVPDEVAPGSLLPNLAFYGPRTAHGSSLSPAIQAALLARAGDPDAALEPFRLASRMDLEDLTGTTAAGLHLATMGGVWQALALGFLGLAPAGDALRVDPRLPSAWDALEMSFRFRGRRVRVRADHGTVTVVPDAPLVVRPDGRAATMVDPDGATFVLDGADGSEQGAVR